MSIFFFYQNNEKIYIWAAVNDTRATLYNIYSELRFSFCAVGGDCGAVMYANEDGPGEVFEGKQL